MLDIPPRRKNTANVTGGKPIAICLQSISGVNAIYHLVAFNDTHGRKREMLFVYFVPFIFFMFLNMYRAPCSLIPMSHPYIKLTDIIKVTRSKLNLSLAPFTVKTMFNKRVRFMGVIIPQMSV
jgi:hypothetical protein